MNFLIMLVLKYVLLTVMLFLMGMFMNCLFDKECLEQLNTEYCPNRMKWVRKELICAVGRGIDRLESGFCIETCYGQNIIDNNWQKGNMGEENKQKQRQKITDWKSPNNLKCVKNYSMIKTSRREWLDDTAQGKGSRNDSANARG